MSRNRQTTRERANPNPPPPTYEPNPKHKDPWQPGRKGSLCPEDLKLPAVVRMFGNSVEWDNARWAVGEGRPFKAHCHDPGRNLWHGFPVGWIEVPAALRQQWLEQEKVRKRDLKRYWSGEQL